MYKDPRLRFHIPGLDASVTYYELKSIFLKMDRSVGSMANENMLFRLSCVVSNHGRFCLTFGSVTKGKCFVFFCGSVRLKNVCSNKNC